MQDALTLVADGVVHDRHQLCCLARSGHTPVVHPDDGLLNAQNPLCKCGHPRHAAKGHSVVVGTRAACEQPNTLCEALSNGLWESSVFHPVHRVRGG